MLDILLIGFGMTKVMGKVPDYLFPLPVVLISCSDKTGKKNLMTVAWVSKVCTEPPLISAAIRPSRLTNSIIKQSGEFVVNIPTEQILKQMDLCGLISGRDVNKFDAAKFTAENATKVRAPLVRECPANFECAVRNSVALGSHDLFIAEVVAVHYDQSILTADGAVDYTKAKPVIYATPGYWRLGECIGKVGFSAAK